MHRVELAIWARRALPYLVLLLPAFAVYHSWLSHSLLISGDWPALTMARQRAFLPFPAVVDSVTSLGTYNLFYSPEMPLYFVQGILATAGSDFAVTERVIWYFPAVLLSLFASYALCVHLTGARWWSLLGAWLYTFNSYNLVMQDRGDIAMSAAHGLLPLVLLLWMRFLDARRITGWLWLGIVLAMAADIAYDLRVAYITILVLALWAVWWLLDAARRGQALAGVTRHIAIRGAAVGVPLIFLEAWWLLPAARVGVPPLPTASGGSQWVSQLSFAQAGDALALSHPFWPTDWYFLTFPIEPLFLAVPIMVAALFLRPVRTASMLFLFSLALISVFLAKGANDPGGDAYVWLFEHVPGFSLFRDPLKFYHSLELAFAVLFTFSAVSIAGWLSRLRAAWGGRGTRMAWPVVCAAVALVPATPTLGVFGQSFTGTLSPSGSDAAHRGWPSAYTRLDHRLAGQPYSRVLWLPASSNYWIASEAHPTLSGMDFGQTYFPGFSDVGSWQWFARRDTPQLLQLLSVQYVAIDADTRNVAYAYLSPAHGASWYVDLCRRWLRGWHESRLGTVTFFQNPHFVPRAFLSSPPGGAAPSALPLLTLPLSHASALALPAPRPRLRTIGSGATHIEMSVPRLKRHTLLVLANEASPLWHISVRTATGSALPDTTQLGISASRQQVDGYANAWTLPPGPGYRVSLSYYPQVVTDEGAAVTLLGLLACIGIALFLSLRSSLRLRLPARIRAPTAGKARPTEVA